MLRMRFALQTPLPPVRDGIANMRGSGRLGREA
jgi:hypothetical protein